MQKNIIENCNNKNDDQINLNEITKSDLNSTQINKSSNPFVEAFQEMNNNPNEKDLMDIMKMVESAMGNSGEEMGDITNLYDENQKLTKKMEDLEKLVLPMTEKLNESNSKIIELTKKLDLIKESVKWDSKFIHNKIDTMKRDIASDVYERVSERGEHYSSSRRRR